MAFNNRSGWIILVLGLGFLMWGKAVWAELQSDPEVLPVSTGGLDSSPAGESAPAVSEPVLPTPGYTESVQKLAEAIPGMETLDPSRGTIWDPTAAPVEEPVAAELEPAESENKGFTLHKPKQSKELIPYEKYFQAGYLAPGVETLGTIIKNFMDKTAMTPVEVVFIDVGTERNLKPGDLLVVINPNQMIKHPLKKGGEIEDREVDAYSGGYQGEFAYWRMLPNTDPMGRLIQVNGYIEILEARPNVSKAVIRRAYKPIRQGDALVPYPSIRPPMVSTDYVPPAKNIQGYIVAWEGDHVLGSTNDVVYIDKGVKDNVRPGDRFEVYVIPQAVHVNPDDPNYFYRSLISPEVTPTLPHIIGELVVVSAQEDTATAVVLNSLMPIIPGQKIRSKRP